MNASSSRSISPLRELVKTSLPGLPMVGVAFVCVVVAAWSVYGMAVHEDFAQAWKLPLILVAVFILAGLYMLQPKEAAILTFFGRYSGTDHGEAAPLFLIGSHLNPGFHGDFPSLDPAKLHRGDVPYTTDFRSLYATLLHDWLQVDETKVLAKPMKRLDLFKPTA